MEQKLRKTGGEVVLGSGETEKELSDGREAITLRDRADKSRESRDAKMGR